VQSVKGKVCAWTFVRVVIVRNVTAWTAKYSDDQRRAIAHAYCDVRIRPMEKIVRMAAAGELRSDANGELVPPFEIPYSSAVYIAKAAARRKAGKLPPELAKQPARDRAHTLQLRLTALIDVELERLERKQKRQPNTAIDAEQIRKVARAMRELATIPDPSEKRLPRVAGEPDANGNQPDGATTDSLAGKLLAASDASMSPSVRARAEGTAHDGRINASDTRSDATETRHGDETQAADRENEREDEKNDAPCSPPRERSGALDTTSLAAA
jgi:hypothetical protein